MDIATVNSTCSPLHTSRWYMRRATGSSVTGVYSVRRSKRAEKQKCSGAQAIGKTKLTDYD
jgi:hypothetical protein